MTNQRGPILNEDMKHIFSQLNILTNEVDSVAIKILDIYKEQKKDLFSALADFDHTQESNVQDLVNQVSTTLQALYPLVELVHNYNKVLSHIVDRQRSIESFTESLINPCSSDCYE